MEDELGFLDELAEDVQKYDKRWYNKDPKMLLKKEMLRRKMEELTCYSLPIEVVVGYKLKDLQAIPEFAALQEHDKRAINNIRRSCRDKMKQNKREREDAAYVVNQKQQRRKYPSVIEAKIQREKEAQLRNEVADAKLAAKTKERNKKNTKS